MYLTDPIEALKHQLDTLGETAKNGFVRLNTPCQVDNLVGWQVLVASSRITSGVWPLTLIRLVGSTFLAVTFCCRV